MSTFAKELDFAKKIVNSLSIPVHITNIFHDNISLENGEIGPHSLVYNRDYLLESSKRMLDYFEEKTIYHIYKDLLCDYYILLLPECEAKSYFMVGPFLDSKISDEEIHKCISTNGFPLESFSNLRDYYDHLTVIGNVNFLTSVLSALGDAIWGDNNYSFAEISNHSSSTISEEFINNNFLSSEDSIWKMDNLFNRYQEENKFLDAVSRGDFQKASMSFDNFVSMQTAEKRATNPLRNRQNYTIIINTLLRKAAERGKVHPIHIDRLSSSFAVKIERAQTISELDDLTSELIRKYCLLVRNHSMQNYSDLLQRTLTIINSDLSADLSLNALANALHVNASYLSTQVKKELGKTLTEYVTEKRINNAIFLLNSSNLQISHIAAQCGIPDIQYFTKIFKKRIGMSPSEYRKMVQAK